VKILLAVPSCTWVFPRRSRPPSLMSQFARAISALPACACLWKRIPMQGTVWARPAITRCWRLDKFESMTGCARNQSLASPVLWQKATLIRCWFSGGGLDRSWRCPPGWPSRRVCFGCLSRRRNEADVGFVRRRACCAPPCRGAWEGHARPGSTHLACWPPVGWASSKPTAAPACGLLPQGSVVPSPPARQRGPTPPLRWGTASDRAELEAEIPGSRRRLLLRAAASPGSGQIEHRRQF